MISTKNVATRERQRGTLEIRPLAPSRVADVRTVLASTFGSQCWDLFFRFTDEQKRAAGIAGKMTPEHEARRKEILAKLARRKRGSAGLVAYADGEAVGFISLGPRSDYPGVERSRSTSAVDDVPVWVIPCITVRKGHRGRGVAIPMIRATAAYAAKKGIAAVEGYARPDGKRVHDGSAHMGTESMFRKAGFKRIRGVVPGLPRYYTPRVTMRATSGTKPRTSSPSRTRSRATS
jgi:GNAT superfamily N-acetyltransferase